MAIVAFALTLFLWPSVGFAATASWRASPDAQGYKLYRAEGSCAAPGWFTYTAQYGQVTSGPIPDPTVGGPHCHFITASNDAGESPVSNYAEFSYTVTPPPECPEVTYCRTLKGQARKHCLQC